MTGTCLSFVIYHWNQNMAGIYFLSDAKKTQKKDLMEWKKNVYCKQSWQRSNIAYSVYSYVEWLWSDLCNIRARKNHPAWKDKIIWRTAADIILDEWSWRDGGTSWQSWDPIIICCHILRQARKFLEQVYGTLNSWRWYRQTKHHLIHRNFHLHKEQSIFTVCGFSDKI